MPLGLGGSRGLAGDRWCPQNSRVRGSLVLGLLLGFGCKEKSKGGEDAGAAPPPVKVVVDSGIVKKEAVPPGPGVRQAQAVEMRGAAKRLKEWVKKAGVDDPNEPWVLAHGLAAFGKNFKAKKGGAAVDVISRGFLEEHRIGGKVAYRSFPEHVGKTAVEPHRHLISKSMLEAGVPLSRKLKLKKGTVTLDQLVADAERTFVVPRTDAEWRNFAWTFDTLLLARGKKGKVKSGTAAIDLRELALRVVHRVEAEQAFLVPLLQEGRPDKVKKRKQAIYAHSCGGIHLIQSAVRAAAYLQDENVNRIMKQQLALLIFRWDAERRIYKTYGARDPASAVLIIIQELKFYGHLLETLALAQASGLLEAELAIRVEVQHMAGDLVDTINKMEGLYVKADELRKVHPQGYYDLLGDGCHAIRGLETTLVAFFDKSAESGAPK